MFYADFRPEHERGSTQTVAVPNKAPDLNSATVPDLAPPVPITEFHWESPPTSLEEAALRIGFLEARIMAQEDEVQRLWMSVTLLRENSQLSLTAKWDQGQRWNITIMK